MSIAKIIQAKKDKKNELVEKSKLINDVTELRSINSQIDEINNEIRELEEVEISNEAGVNQNDINNRNAFNPIATFRNINNNVNTNNNHYENNDKNDILGNIAIRKGVPFGGNLNSDENRMESKLDLGKYVRGVVTGNWEGAELERRAVTTTTAGAVIPETLSDDFIDRSRNVSMFTAADVPIVKCNGPMTFARLKQIPVIKFKEEAKAAQESGFELESLSLNPKTAYGYAYISMEALASGVNLTNILQEVFGQAIAECIDQGMLYGQYNSVTSSYDKFAPKGIMNDEDILTVEAKEGEGYDSLIKAIGKIRYHNGEPTNYAINSNTDEIFSLKKTTTGEYLSKPTSLDKYMPIITNQLKSDEGTGNDAIVFDKNAMLIGLQRNICFEVFTNSDKCVKEGLIGFKLHAMMDCVITRPTHICKITGIK